MPYYLYQITNSTDGKRYVGMSAKPRDRWACHLAYAKSGRGFLLHDAMRTIGSKHFGFQILSEYEKRADCRAAERALISALNLRSSDYGYNVLPGGHDVHDAIVLARGVRAEIKSANPEAEALRASEIAKKRDALLPLEIKQLRMRKAHLAMGSEAMAERGRSLASRLTMEERKAKTVKANDTLGSEGRKQRSQKAMATMGPEGLRARALKTVAAQTPEQRSAARRKAWATVRARKEAANRRFVLEDVAGMTITTTQNGVTRTVSLAEFSKT